MLQRIKSKKGFTLAELLIVVAIIAVLTAIAVPLFVTSLQKAKEAAFEANKDVVRTAGISTILNTPDSDTYKLSDLEAGSIFIVTGSFTNGKFNNTVTVTYVPKDQVATEKGKTPPTGFKDWDENGSITVYIDVADIGEAKVKPAATV